MIADFILGLWLVMATIYGWKRKALLEFNSLLIFAISYGSARFVGTAVATPLAPTFGLGPIGTEVAVSFGLCLVLYILLGLLWKKIRPVGSEAGIRIELDADGNPIVKGAKIKSFFGALFGITRSILMYFAVIYWLLLLVPILSYKDGKGLTVVHPKSYVIRTLRQVDPLLLEIDWSVKGLRSLRYINKSRAAKKQAFRSPVLKKLLKTTQMKKLRRNKKLLARANSKKQGRRDGTLLLWMTDFQKLLHSANGPNQLKLLAQALPAPFDRDSATKVSKKRPIRIKRRRRRKRRK